MNLTEEQKKLASKIYNSIHIVLTPTQEKELGLDTSEKVYRYVHEQKMIQTKEQLLKRNITL